MSADEAFSKQLEELSRLVIVPQSAPNLSSDNDAKRAVEDESKFLSNALQAEILADSQAARAQRETYAGRIFALVCVWISFIFILLFLQGFGDFLRYKPLSDKVLITLITSTTVNVIATLIIVLKYIFKLPESHSRNPISPKAPKRTAQDR
jgi:hypothetical protein